LFSHPLLGIGKDPLQTLTYDVVGGFVSLAAGAVHLDQIGFQNVTGVPAG
jgi:hypothetical protein